MEQDRLNLTIDADTALVVFDLLSRSNGAVQPLHPGERSALAQLKLALERALMRPLEARGERVVDSARQRLRDVDNVERSPIRVCYVDVDDTLVRSFGSKRIPINTMVERVRELHAAGTELYCWSSGGATYALSSAQELGIDGCFTAYLPKPHLMLDDLVPAQWRDLVCLHPNVAGSLSADELLAQSAPVWSRGR